MIYLCVYVLLAFTTIFEINNKVNKRTTNLYITIISLLWMLLSSFRWQRGTDWDSYYTFYMGNPLIKDWRGFEIGYKLLNFIVKELSNSNYTVFLMVCAIIIFLFQRRSILDMTYNYGVIDTINEIENPEFNAYHSLIMLGLWSTYIGNIYVTRSIIAYIILLFSFRYIIKQNLLKFIICIIMATLFHRTSIVFVLAYFVYNMKFIKHIVIISLIAVPTIVFTFPVIMVKLAGLLGNEFLVRVNLYLQGNGNRSISGLINTIFLLGVFYIAYKLKYKSDNYYRGMLNLYYIGCLVYIAAYMFGSVFNRIAGQFMIVQVILIPKLIKLGNKKWKKIIIGILIVLYYGLRLFSTIRNYWDLYIPYKSIFNMNLEVITY